VTQDQIRQIHEDQTSNWTTNAVYVMPHLESHQHCSGGNKSFREAVGLINGCSAQDRFHRAVSE
jgi:hypothetical protein